MKTNNKSKQSKTSFKKWIIAFWSLIFLGFIFAGIVLYAASEGILGFEPLPSVKELENPKSNLASEIISADGKLLGKYFKENRINVTYDQLSPYLPQALVATEDERFYDHSGVDLKGLARAVIKLGKAGGASTITQQLAKMLFHERSLSLVGRIKQKIQEWIIATELEKRYTKEEIIAMYLNKFDFLNNAVGIKSATNVYFDKEPNELTIEEAAMLIGMAKNPSLFNPIRRPDTTMHRRNVVLFQMKRNGFITQQQYDSLKLLPLELHYKKVDHKEGIAPYFREVLRLELQKLLSQKDENGNYIYHKNDGSPYNIYKDGLKIYTTIDSRMQQYAEYAVHEHLKNLQPAFFRDVKRRRNPPFDNRLSKKQVQSIITSAIKRSVRYQTLAGKECPNCHRRTFIKTTKHHGKEYYICTAEDCGKEWPVRTDEEIQKIFESPVKMRVFTFQGEKDTLLSPKDSILYYKQILQAGLMSVDPHTGYIRAWVGGVDIKHFAYDHVYQAKRQVGSTFKPFVYSLAIQEGYSPCYEVPNQKVVFKKGEFGLLKDWAPKNSDGIYGCNVSLKYGLANSMNTITAWVMKQFGPQAVVDMAHRIGIQSKLDPVPSLCLGVADLSLYEMVGANATFVNKGVWIKPTFYTRIEDKNGNIILDVIPESREALSEETAYVMLNLMKGVVDGVYNKCIGDLRKSLGKSPMYVSGTGMRLRGRKTEKRPYVGFKNPIAGKTGTTQNQSDGWFMGLTPDLVTGVWVGAEDRSVHFRSIANGQGANTALPIWGYYMNKVFADSTIKVSQGDFPKPETPINIELDCEKYRSHQSGTDDDSWE